jgi:hypothetical protein
MQVLYCGWQLQQQPQSQLGRSLRPSQHSKKNPARPAPAICSAFALSLLVLVPKPVMHAPVPDLPEFPSSQPGTARHQASFHKPKPAKTRPRWSTGACSPLVSPLRPNPGLPQCVPPCQMCAATKAGKPTPHTDRRRVPGLRFIAGYRRCVARGAALRMDSLLVTFRAPIPVCPASEAEAGKPTPHTYRRRVLLGAGDGT